MTSRADAQNENTINEQQFDFRLDCRIMMNNRDWNRNVSGAESANKNSDVTHLHNSEDRALPFQATGYVQEASLDWFAEVLSCGDV